MRSKLAMASLQLKTTMKRLIGVLFIVVIIASESGAYAQPQAAAAENQCADGTAAAADSLAARFRDHQFVFIGSTHGDVKIEESLRCLVSRAAFAQRATDVVVEWASSAHQQLLEELARRMTIMNEGPSTMRARYGGGALWFRGHPNDFPGFSRSPSKFLNMLPLKAAWLKSA
jgi:hypothetical protein